MSKAFRVSVLGVFFSLTACFAQAAADSVWFSRNWQSDKGLPNNTVFGLAQSSDGYVWLATSVGLVSFDGNRFLKHAFTNLVFEGNRGVFTILNSSNGMWVGMDRGGVAYLRGEDTQVFTPKDGLLDAQVQALGEDREGTMWVAYLGGGIRCIKNGRVTTVSAQDHLPAEFTAMTCDKDGSLWWAGGNRVWVHQQTGFMLMAEGSDPLTCICAAAKGGIWIADARSRLCYCDASGHVTNCGAFAPTNSPDAASVLYEDAGGALWIGTVSGRLLRFNGSTFEIAEVLHPQIQALLEDREGNMWAGTQGGGLYQICRRVIRMEGAESGLPGATVNSLCQDGNGGLWAVTENGLLAHYTGEKWEPFTNEYWPGEFFACVNVARDGTLWLGSRSRKIHGWRDGKPVPGHFPEMPSSIQALLGDSKGNLWVGGVNYLLRSRDGDIKLFPVPADAHSIRALAEDSQGTVWVGSSRSILLRVQGDEVTPFAVPNVGTDSSIRCLMAGTDGSVWIGHAGLGVARIKNGKYAHVGTEQGLFDDYISQIIADDHGWLWFGSDRGIFKVRQRELEEVMDGQTQRVGSVLSGDDQGVANLQAVFGHSPETARSGDGRLWIPTRSGLAVIDPGPSKKAGGPSQIVLEKVILDGRVLAQYKNILPTWESKGEETLDLRKAHDPLRLPPDYRRLDIEFTTLNFAALQNIHFRYRLAGLDQDWLESSPQRNASYSRLSRGNYRFEVQVRSGEDDWSASSEGLALTVLPYFWQTGWFITLASLAVLGSVAGSVRYFEKKRMQRQLAQLERERAVERERARIAKDIHDDMGASLTRITMLSQLALNKPESAKMPAAELSRIYDTARSMTNAMDEIVWAINPSHDTLESLAVYFAEFVQEFLMPTGLQFNLDIPLALPRWNISSEVRHNLFLAFKEALNNVVKHSKATEVIVALEVRDSGLVLSVKDNGQGFDITKGPANGRQGNGLNNMRLRLEEIHGRCILESAAGRGTRVAFELEIRA